MIYDSWERRSKHNPKIEHNTVLIKVSFDEGKKVDASVKKKNKNKN